MRTFSPRYSVILFFLAFAGCSTARKIVIRPGSGGTVAISDSEAGRGKAESIMSEVCKGKKFRIVEERESVVGNVIEKDATQSTDFTLNNSEAKKADAGRSREEHFLSPNEWRISFQCD